MVHSNVKVPLLINPRVLWRKAEHSLNVISHTHTHTHTHIHTQHTYTHTTHNTTHVMCSSTTQSPCLINSTSPSVLLEAESHHQKRRHFVSCFITQPLCIQEHPYTGTSTLLTVRSSATTHTCTCPYTW